MESPFGIAILLYKCEMDSVVTLFILCVPIQLAFTGTKMAVSKMFIDQFTYWAPGINMVYLFR